MPIRQPSLRLKLTLWFLAIFSIVFLGVLLAAGLLQRDAALRSLDERLQKLAMSIASAIEETDGDFGKAGLQPFQPPDRTFVLLAVRDYRGDLIASRGRVDTDALPPVPAMEEGQAVFRPLDGDVARRLLGGPITSRMVTWRFMMPDGAVRFIDLARTSDIRGELRTFFQDGVMVGAVGALLASAIAAWLVAGRAVAPLRRLGDAAKQITPESVEGRIAVDSSDPEVERLQGELNDALARLEAGYRAQERFISNVAHDLKTPISVMLTQSQVLRYGLLSDGDFEAYRESMVVELKRLGGLVEGFLTLARADRGETLARVTNVAVRDVVVEAVAQCHANAGRRGVRLVTTLPEGESDDDELGVQGDPDLLRTMLANLIRNAIRHGPAGETVDVAATHADGVAVISIRDRGPGIPEALLERVFDRFVQVADDDAPPSGTGLGLAIAQSIAQLHGGSIDACNVADRGCVFTVRLPLDGSAAEASNGSG